MGGLARGPETRCLDPGSAAHEKRRAALPRPRARARAGAPACVMAGACTGKTPRYRGTPLEQRVALRRRPDQSAALSQDGLQDLGSLVGHAVEPERRRGRTDDFDRSLAQRVRRSHESAGPVLDERVPAAVTRKDDALVGERREQVAGSGVGATDPRALQLRERLVAGARGIDGAEGRSADVGLELLAGRVHVVGCAGREEPKPRPRRERDDLHGVHATVRAGELDLVGAGTQRCRRIDDLERARIACRGTCNQGQVLRRTRGVREEDEVAVARELDGRRVRRNGLDERGLRR